MQIYMELVSILVPWFVNAFVCKQFVLQAEAFSKNTFLFLVSNPASSDKHDHSQPSHKNTNMAIFTKIVEQIKLNL